MNRDVATFRWFLLSIGLSAGLIVGCEGMIDDPLGDGPPSIEDRETEEIVPTDPGGITLRRLTRAEYNNTVAILLGTELTPADAFPADDVSLGFDNIGSVLSLSPVHIELHENAADALLEELFARAPSDPVRQRILSCAMTDMVCAEEILADFTPTAWRRPVSGEELDRLLGLVQFARSEGRSFSFGIRQALKGVLLSPFFTFRVELDELPLSSAVHPLSAHELATRLSYFLWSGPPDEALRDAADSGRLLDPTELRAQAIRMLDHPRAEALVDNFAGQWLYTRALMDHEADYEAYPDFDDELRASMREETERFFSHFLNEELPLEQMLEADFTFIDERLAEHYEVETSGAGFQRATVPGRSGLLGQGGILTVTSTPARTSPVKRGKWVLEQLLCDAPPAPPPGVEGLAEPPEDEPMTLREQLESHRTQAVCAGCHKLMDPIGFGLEAFDGIGHTRTHDEWGPVDTTGEIPEMGEFVDAVTMTELLSGDIRFNRCVTEKLMTYALGRLFEGRQDAAWVRVITEDSISNGGSLRSTILAVVTSEPFTTRRGEVSE